MREISNRYIPHFLSARSPQGLRRQMLLNNARTGYFYTYFDIQNVKGVWYAWFLREISSDDVERLSSDNPQE